MMRLATLVLFIVAGAGDLRVQSAAAADGGTTASASPPSIQSRLESTTVDRVQFNQATLESALDYLGERAGGVRFLILDSADHRGVASKAVTLSLRGVPATTVLKYLCDLTGCRYRVETYAVVVGRADDLAALKQLRRSNPQPPPSSLVLASLRSTRLTSVDLRETSVEAALGFLRGKMAADGSGGPANFVILEGRDDPKAIPAASREVTMRLDQVSALTALRYLTELSGLGFRVDHRAVVIGDPAKLSYRPSHKVSRQSAIFRLMSAKMIEKVRFNRVSLVDAVDAVRYYSRSANSKSDGINVINRAADSQAVIDLHLDQVSLSDLVGYISEQSGTRVRTESLALVVETDPEAEQRAKEVAKAVADSAAGNAGATTSTNGKASGSSAAPGGKKGAEELGFD